MHSAKDEGAVSKLNCDSPIKKVSVQAQLPSKFYNERIATSRLRCAIFVDEGRALRFRRPLVIPRSDHGTSEAEVFVSAFSLGGNYQKPWPSRKGSGVEELIKYMSNVPCYLQRIKKVENAQGKALNFGVIDWRRLESWRSGEKTDQNNMNMIHKSCSYSDPSSSKSEEHEYRISLQSEAGNYSKDEKSTHCEKPSSMLDGQLSDTNIRNKTSSTIHGDEQRMKVHKSSQKSSRHGRVSSDIGVFGLVSARFQSDESSSSADALPTTNGVTSPSCMPKNECNQIGTSSCNSLVSRDEKSSNQKVEGISVEKMQPLLKHPSAAGLKWLNQNSSSKAMSTSHQHKNANDLDVSDDKGRNNCRGRRSPIRRMLDPLLKPKYDCNFRATARSPINRSQEQLNNQSLTGEESSSINTMNWSSDTSFGHFNSQVPITSKGYGVPMRQALVKLAWKNAQPLFMFSTNDSNVLVASMRRTGGNDDSDAVYTIVTAQESKKKTRIWTGQSKTRKPNLLYDVVGRIEVTCSKLSSFDSKNLEISKQFVLFGDKLLTLEESSNSKHHSELAALVVKASYQKLMGSICNTHVESLQIERYPEYSRMCSITAILPSGIHGLSDTGKPSTIIERWKSGGSCDCGGWDEGCRLTVLTDRLHKMKIIGSVPECPAADGDQHIELFIQGRKGENNYVFSMIAFKEGLYTVEFCSSIASLHAFAICIAALHNINSIGAGDNYQRMNSMQRNGSLTGYEPHQPPFSPVGRS